MSRIKSMVLYFFLDLHVFSCLHIRLHSSQPLELSSEFNPKPFILAPNIFLCLHKDCLTFIVLLGPFLWSDKFNNIAKCGGCMDRGVIKIVRDCSAQKSWCTKMFFFLLVDIISPQERYRMLIHTVSIKKYYYTNLGIISFSFTLSNAN